MVYGHAQFSFLHLDRQELSVPVSPHSFSSDVANVRGKRVYVCRRRHGLWWDWVRRTFWQKPYVVYTDIRSLFLTVCVCGHGRMYLRYGIVFGNKLNALLYMGSTDL